MLPAVFLGFGPVSMFCVVQRSNASRCTDVVDKSAGKPHVRADDVQQIDHTMIVLGLSGSAGSTCHIFPWQTGRFSRTWLGWHPQPKQAKKM